MHKYKKIAILADGTYPRAQYPLEILAQADIVICCDASVEKLKGREPNFIVGDMDTLSPTLQEKYSDIIHKSSCQETNDLTKSFSFALGLISSSESGEINILGATGCREDHSLGNISLLAEYAKNVNNQIPPFNNKMREEIKTSIVTDYGIFTAYNNSVKLNAPVGSQISIFAFDNSLKIKSHGLKYPTDNVTFDMWWKATLNQTTQESVTLDFNHPSTILIYRPF